MLSQITGSTTSAEITTGTRPFATQSSTRMMKLATGVARTTRTAGASSACSSDNRFVSSAVRMPSTMPSSSPSVMRSSVSAV